MKSSILDYIIYTETKIGQNVPHERENDKLGNKIAWFCSPVYHLKLRLMDSGILPVEFKDDVTRDAGFVDLGHVSGESFADAGVLG